jgi:signal transduction histidine kinase
MPTDHERWPLRDHALDILWGVFAVANLVAMAIIPAWETVPFHFIWVSLTIVYGFRVWKTQSTMWTLAVVMLLTGSAIAHDVAIGAQSADEITEVPLMAAMFVAMVWHARRRLGAMQQVEKVSDANRRLLDRETRFLQDASHQLRTPITIALGHAELIERGSAGQVREDARVVVEELLRLRRLADLLLAMAAGEGQVTNEMEIELDIMIAETLGRWKPTPREWRIGRLDTATVVADPDQLQLVVDELVGNAVAHTEPADRITLGVQRRDDSAVISVADSGTGIDRPDLDRIFDRFARSTSGSRRNQSGLGLGLSLVKSVAESHGGTVTVRSSLGAGSVFELSLPAARPAAPEASEPSEPVPARRGHTRTRAP